MKLHLRYPRLSLLGLKPLSTGDYSDLTSASLDSLNTL